MKVPRQVLVVFLFFGTLYGLLGVSHLPTRGVLSVAGAFLLGYVFVLLYAVIGTLFICSFGMLLLRYLGPAINAYGDFGTDLFFNLTNSEWHHQNLTVLRGLCIKCRQEPSKVWHWLKGVFSRLLLRFTLGVKLGVIALQMGVGLSTIQKFNSILDQYP